MTPFSATYYHLPCRQPPTTHLHYRKPVFRLPTTCFWTLKTYIPFSTTHIPSSSTHNPFSNAHKLPQPIYTTHDLSLTANNCFQLVTTNLYHTQPIFEHPQPIFDHPQLFPTARNLFTPPATHFRLSTTYSWLPTSHLGHSHPFLNPHWHISFKPPTSHFWLPTTTHNLFSNVYISFTLTTTHLNP